MEFGDLAKEDGMSPDEALNFIDEVDVPYNNILRQLFVWCSTKKAVTGCTSMATSEEASELQEQLHEEITPPPAREAPQIPQRYINPAFHATATACLA